MAKNTKFGDYTPPSYSRMTMKDEPTKKRRPKNLRNNPARLGDAADEAAEIKKLSVIRDSAGELERAEMATPVITNEANAAYSRSIRPLPVKYSEGSNKGKDKDKDKGKDKPKDTDKGEEKKSGKAPIVSQKLLDSKGLNLNAFMNAYKHDGKEWKLRDKPLMRKTMVDAIDREKSDRHAKGGSVKSKSKSASSRGDGIAQRGKTRA